LLMFEAFLRNVVDGDARVQPSEAAAETVPA
jgi:hypothetical protein